MRRVGGEASDAFPVCQSFAFPFISLGSVFSRAAAVGDSWGCLASWRIRWEPVASEILETPLGP